MTNKYDINDRLYYYNERLNCIEETIIFAITYDVKDEEIKYNYKFFEHELFGVYNDAFNYVRKYLKEKYELYEKDFIMKEGEHNANG